MWILENATDLLCKNTLITLCEDILQNVLIIILGILALFLFFSQDLFGKLEVKSHCAVYSDPGKIWVHALQLPPHAISS